MLDNNSSGVHYGHVTKNCFSLCSSNVLNKKVLVQIYDINPRHEISTFAVLLSSELAVNNFRDDSANLLSFYKIVHERDRHL